MKQILTFLCALLSFAMLKAEKDVRFFMNSGEVRTVAMSRIDSLSFDDSEEYLIVTLFDGCDSLLINNIDSVACGELSSAVTVAYAGERAFVENPFAFDGVEVNITGAKVVVNSTIDTDVDYILSGSSDEGCFKIYGTKKYTLRLNGVELANDSGAAINSQCKKRGKIILEDGTVNTLSDAAEYTSTLSEDEKATIFGEGQFVFEGGGSLNIVANKKHGICSDDYLAFRGGNITVVSAASDAVHCNDSLIVSGGVLALSPDGDGFDCEGHIVVSGGEITVELQGEDKEAVKAVGNIDILGGSLVVVSSGDVSKGIKSDRNISISGGDIDVTVTGNSVAYSGDVSYCSAIKCDSLFTMTAGNLKIEATGVASRGISADYDINLLGGECEIACSGNYGLYDPSESVEEEETESVASYVVYVSVPSNSSSGNNRPGASSSAWSNIYLYDSNDALIATLTNSVTLNGTTFYYYDFGEAVTGEYYFKSDNYRNYTIKSSSFTGVNSDTYYSISSSYTTSNSARVYTMSDVTETYADASLSQGSTTEESFAAACVKSDGNVVFSGGTYAFSTSGDASKGVKSEGNCFVNGGDIKISTTGKAAIVAYDPVYCTAIKCDGDFSMSGGNINIETSGQGGLGISADGALTVSGGIADITIGGAGASYTATSGTDYYSVKALKSDGAMTLVGGTINCLATANGGKCIVSDGLLTIGAEGDASGYPYITAKTTGAALGTSSGSTGAMGGMGGNEGFNGAPKAIKGAADVVVNAGTISLSTAADGGEGLESKATLTINGGSLCCETYDDAINAATSFVVNGGNIYAYASNNDAIDSNGTMAVNGGVVLASGATQPEGAFDCDNNSFVITGGILVGTGGEASSPTSTTQYYASLSSVTVSQGKYLVFKSADGEVLFSYRCPNTINSASVFVSSPSFTSSSHTMLYGVSEVSSPDDSYFDGVFVVGGTATGGTSKSFTPAIK